MKFTEEQYQKIVETFERIYDYAEIVRELGRLVISIGHYSEIEQAILLAIPESREWAHEQYVEKEKRYVWHSKKNNKNGKPIRLFKDLAQTVKSASVDFTDEVTLDEHLTESEIREWGYDPERFDKEEVE